MRSVLPAFGLILFLCCPAVGASDEPFDTMPIPAPTHPLILREWQAMPQKLKADAAALSACMQDEDFCTPAARLLAAMVNRVKALSFFDKFEEVDTAVNRMIAYVSDAAQWIPVQTDETVEVWSSPLETAASRRGDCDDYVHLKLFLLWQSGVPLERMRLVLLEHKDDSEMHIVLAVRGERFWFLLDNNAIRRAAHPNVVYVLPPYAPDRAVSTVAAVQAHTR